MLLQLVKRRLSVICLTICSPDARVNWFSIKLCRTYKLFIGRPVSKRPHVDFCRNGRVWAKNALLGSMQAYIATASKRIPDRSWIYSGGVYSGEVGIIRSLWSEGRKNKMLKYPIFLKLFDESLLVAYGFPYFYILGTTELNLVFICPPPLCGTFFSIDSPFVFSFFFPLP